MAFWITPIHVVSAAELYYLHHLRSCAASACGARGHSAGSRCGSFSLLFGIMMTAVVFIFALLFAFVMKLLGPFSIDACMFILSFLAACLQAYFVLVNFHARTLWGCRIISITLASALWFPWIWWLHGLSLPGLMDSFLVLAHVCLFPPFGKKASRTPEDRTLTIARFEEAASQATLEAQKGYGGKVLCEYLGLPSGERAQQDYERDPAQWGPLKWTRKVAFRWTVDSIPGDPKQVRVNNVFSRGIPKPLLSGPEFNKNDTLFKCDVCMSTISEAAHRNFVRESCHLCWRCHLQQSTATLPHCKNVSAYYIACPNSRERKSGGEFCEQCSLAKSNRKCRNAASTVKPCQNTVSTGKNGTGEAGFCGSCLKDMAVMLGKTEKDGKIEEDFSLALYCPELLGLCTNYTNPRVKCGGFVQETKRSHHCSKCYGKIWVTQDDCVIRLCKNAAAAKSPCTNAAVGSNKDGDLCRACLNEKEQHKRAEKDLCKTSVCQRVPVKGCGGYCLQCFRSGIDIEILPQDRKSVLEHELEEAIKSLPEAQRVSGEEAPLQCYMPHRHYALPPYAETAEFLPWHHCRLCFAVLDGESDVAFQKSLAEHALSVHGVPLQEFRRRVLETVMADFPTPITVQTHRTLLHRYRSYLSEDNFTFLGCACCGRRHVRSSMCRAIFPALGDTVLPTWLSEAKFPWSQESWDILSETWLQSLAMCFCTERYLNVHFHAEARLAYALNKESNSPDAAAGARFRRRVEDYIACMRADLEADAVASPSGVEGPWLFLQSSCDVRAKQSSAAISPSDTTSSLPATEASARELRAFLCKSCAHILSRKPEKVLSEKAKREGYKDFLRFMPKEARANGFWGGPMPAAISNLGFLGCKIIRLAHVTCLLLRVPLPQKQYHALVRSGAELPQYHVGNVMAYPQYSQDIPTLLGVLPDKLSEVLLVQFDGPHAYFKKHPEITISIPLLREAFQWLLTHNWDWILATEDEDVDTVNDKYGPTVEALLQAYQKNLGGEESGVPECVFKAATTVGESSSLHAAQGPAEAAQDAAPPEQAGGAIIDQAPSDILALEQVGVLLKQHETVVALEGQAAEAQASGNDTEQLQTLQLELAELQKARQAIHSLTSSKLREQLNSFREEAADQYRVKATVKCGPTILSSYAPDFWRKVFVDAFPRGDCQEHDGCTREGKVAGVDWSDLLLNQVDKPWFRTHKEWQATAYKYILRRAQIRAVQALVRTDQSFKREAESLLRLNSEHLLHLALQTSDAASLRKIIYDDSVVKHVRQSLYQVVRVMRSVQGTDSERHKFHSWFEALRINKGCAVIFWTLNPRDTDSALTVRFMAEGLWHHRVIPLNVSEMAVHDAFQEIRAESPNALHDMISQDTVAANKCFHETIRLTLGHLFNCAPCSNTLETGTFGTMNADGFPCFLTPGMVGYLSWFLGITEPQLRKSLHLHALMGLLGFRNPEELFAHTDFAETFVRIWKFVASLCFRGPEAFASFTGSAVAMEALAQEPLIPVKPEQRKMVDKDYVKECYVAQRQARGLPANGAPNDGHESQSLQLPSIGPEEKGATLRYESLAPLWLADANSNSDSWASKASKHVNTAFRSCGNHTCLPHVCFKGKYGKKGLCRMFYWHWRLRPSKRDRGKLVFKRLKGRQLQPRWCPTPEDPKSMVPPVDSNPPLRGLPALETNHGFACRFNPCGSLGPSCNHDINVLLRLPVLSDKLQELLGDILCQKRSDTMIEESLLQEFSAACSEMHQAILEHEFYSSAYASKEQPKLESLLQSMYKSLRYLEGELEAARKAGKVELEDMERASKMLHRLVSATNNASHKGFPEMVSHLTKQPNFYCSHAFAHLHLFNVQNAAVAHVEAIVSEITSKAPLGDPQHALCVIPYVPRTANSGFGKGLRDTDYMWRPELLSNVCWYFFAASTDATTEGPALPWHVHQGKDGVWVTHPGAQICRSKHVKDTLLKTFDSDKPLVKASHYCQLILDNPWRVPVVYGHRPFAPNEHSSFREKGLYGLWMLLLFKPWRRLREDILLPCWTDVSENDACDPWEAIYRYYAKWAGELETLARRTKEAYADESSP